ncbi:MAG TPA: gephyrin-like molybdotransferase Glp [Myxococcaceae bacterium]|nr:gephyrin-like molybdotransferase Glp [Myxococcaceae bacterium]
MDGSGHTLLSVSDARARVLALCAPLPREEAPVDSAVGRALLETVVAARTVPPWDNSAMDGYAVRSVDAAAPGARLTVVATIMAGQTPACRLGPGECARIMTGAPIPEGADAVVMQEKATRAGDAVELLEAVRPRQHVRDLGEDARAGEPLLAAGTVLGVPEAGMLWGQGLTKVPVPRRPKVAVLSTGDELCHFDQPEPGKIVDTNGPSLALAAKRLGAVVTSLGIARDEAEDVLERLRPGLGFDAVITSAGVSVGERDVVKDALLALGVEMSFWRVAIKPGKPLAVGRKGRTVFFGLPGNPTSSLVSFELFVRPALRRMMGHADVEPPRVPGRLDVDAPLSKPAGMVHYVRATAPLRDGALRARPLPSQTSGALQSAALATHLIELPAEGTRFAAGDAVALLPVSWAG